MDLKCICQTATPEADEEMVEENIIKDYLIDENGEPIPLREDEFKAKKARLIIEKQQHHIHE